MAERTYRQALGRNGLMKKHRIVIVGAGQGGSALIELFKDDPTVKIVAVADIDKNAPGMLLAARLGIKAITELSDLLNEKPVHLVIDVTGSRRAAKRIADIFPSETEVISGTSARFVWDLIETKKQTRDLEAHYKLALTALEPVAQEEFIIGENREMVEVRNLISKVAPTPTTVLITGESGTGKELVARSIHRQSSRAHFQMVTLNCTALASTLLESELFGHKKGSFTGAVSDRQGLFEVAHGSTMFLDEIGDMALETQAKLLRTLQTGEIRPVGSTQSRNVDVRIIAATNRDMLKAMREGRFREDLFYRINTFTINLPPLRYRGEDLPLLVDYFLRRACARINKRVDHVSPTAISLLREYNWPGNLREMQNVIESAVIMAGSEMIEPENIFFPHDNRAPQRVSNMKFMDAKAAAIGEFERQSLTRYLAESAGNISKAAESAGLSRRTFHRLMEKHRISSRRNRE